MVANSGASSGPTKSIQDWPSSRIRYVVPYAPGGGADAVARILAKRVGDSLGQTVVVENRGGAGSIIGTDLVAKADPDGYTLLLGQSGPISINPAVYKTLPYDPVKDFVPITMTNSYPYVLVVNAKLPATSLQEFVALGKSNPDSMNYGTTGVGAANHLMSELFNSKAGLKMTHIPYRGTALAVPDLAASGHHGLRRSGQACSPHIRSGTLRALAVTGSPAAPPRSPRTSRPSRRAAIPTSTPIAWHGLLAPARTPPGDLARSSTRRS